MQGYIASLGYMTPSFLKKKKKMRLVAKVKLTCLMVIPGLDKEEVK